MSVLAIAHSFPGSAIGWFPSQNEPQCVASLQAQTNLCVIIIAYAWQEFYPYQYVILITIR
jgi:hypothetical protein